MSKPRKQARPRRRTRGEGSASLSGTLDAEGRGLWVLQLSSQNAASKRIRKKLRFRGTKDEAARELARLRLRAADGSLDPSNELLRDFLVERWLPSVRADLATRTYIRYKGIVEQHLLPALGGLRLSKLTAAHVDAAKQEWLRAGRARKDERKGSPLAPRSVLHILRVLHNGLERAIEWGLVARNVADYVKAPRMARAKTRALNGEEASKLLAAARGSMMFAPIVVALTTGVRRGELLGLRWRDFDEQAATLTVARSVEQTRGCLTFKDPKNDRVRMLKLGAFTVSVLQERRKAQHAQMFHRRRLGLPYEQLDLIFAHEDGRIWPPATFGWRFGTIVKKAEIGAFRLHDLRHSSASLLIAQGVDMKRVSERLGHSGIAITADTYGHLFVDGQTAAADAIDSVVSAAAKVQVTGA
jgi:integrase